MLVEDNLPFRDAFRGGLLSQLLSIRVIEATHGEEAFKRLASDPVDIVFMDIRLPGESGLKLTEKIKADHKDVTIAILTSYDSVEYREAAARCGAGCFIAKGSIHWDQILTFVRCFQKAKDTGRLKPGCVRLSSAWNN